MAIAPTGAAKCSPICHPRRPFPGLKSVRRSAFLSAGCAGREKGPQ
ncbi:hypothetical protein Z950_2583 [Sulfitobacter mediterraneus KCTC 32188]|nr:hypothetical protein Z950_2583 [Sulfitobacter mediterraneus KCTC 32188]